MNLYRSPDVTRRLGNPTFGRRGAVGLLLAVTVAGAVALPASASAAGRTTACATAVAASLPSNDPTALAIEPQVTVRARDGRKLSRVRVELLRDGRRVASGSRAKRVPAGGAPVALRLVRGLRPGSYQLRTRATVAGCGTVSRTSQVRLGPASLPVRAVSRSTAVGTDPHVVRVLLRPLGDRRSQAVRVRILDAAGAARASTTVRGTLTATTEVELRAAQPLTAGRYRIEVSGRSSGIPGRARTVEPLVLGAAASASVGTTAVAPSRQRAVLDWSAGRSSGRDAVAVVLPGIGHGEVVCRPDTQWLRVFPGDRRRELSMMTWTYKDWATNTGKALREALHTTGTGPDFSERFAEFIPSEKRSTGEFIALLSDRGTIGQPGGEAVAPPISIHVTWVWDFDRSGAESCHATVEVVAETADTSGSAVRSAQLLWRGEGAAAGHDTAAVDVPGLGRLAIVCQAGPAGQRTVSLDAPAGATIITRQATEDSSMTQAAGPVVVELPGNGQLELQVPGGGRVLLASRWKVNDPDPAQNTCAVSAQAIAP